MKIYGLLGSVCFEIQPTSNIFSRMFFLKFLCEVSKCNPTTECSYMVTVNLTLARMMGSVSCLNAKLQVQVAISLWTLINGISLRENDICSCQLGFWDYPETVISGPWCEPQIGFSTGERGAFMYNAFGTFFHSSVNITLYFPLYLSHVFHTHMDMSNVRWFCWLLLLPLNPLEWPIAHYFV